jgi:hypothetical protein
VYSKQLDEIEGRAKAEITETPGVDRLLTEIRAEKAEQAAWEERMRINTVLDPVPVRVDARMRPVTG